MQNIIEKSYVIYLKAFVKFYHFTDNLLKATYDCFKNMYKTCKIPHAYFNIKFRVKSFKKKFRIQILIKCFTYIDYFNLCLLQLKIPCIIARTLKHKL